MVERLLGDHSERTGGPRVSSSRSRHAPTFDTIHFAMMPQMQGQTTPKMATRCHLRVAAAVPHACGRIWSWRFVTAPAPASPCAAQAGAVA